MKNKHKKSEYVPNKIESKWQKRWEKDELYRAYDDSSRPKSYILIEFPYPSGERMHVGHARSYCAFDAVARLRRMRGQNVLFPMGWDAFGLPAENYAIKTGIHPSITVKKNIENAKKQLVSWGLSFDWDREVNTTDPSYYKWTQWVFLQLFKKGLAYRDQINVNWCPSCKINLANEEVISGKCERCGHGTERRLQTQWLLKITDYAQKLLDDLDTVNYRNDIKMQQVNWIGRKEGVNITYPVVDTPFEITCFTTRPDTNFGATFIVLSPEHPLALDIASPSEAKKIKKYIEEATKKSERERLADAKQKTGVFTGSYALNRLNDKKMPIYIGDFVLNSVGTGAVVGVPGHDKRDFEFAEALGIEVQRVVIGPDKNSAPIAKIEDVFEGYGENINSGFLNGMKTEDSLAKVTLYLEERGFGKSTVDFHLRDWVFSRQHYWGEPIPIIHCEKCGEVSVPEDQLPVELPFVEKYQPTDTGESPLAAVENWVNVSCPKCGGSAKRETDTMPNWAGSSWYFLRYIDPKNDNVFASKELLEQWLPIDWYNGGLEHTTLHLLYSRFWHKFLFDNGHVPTSEPFAKRTSHGVVLGPDGLRMSKSKGNVINPDDIVENLGADTLRLYILFIGPFEQNVAWSHESVLGVRRFLNKVWGFGTNVIENNSASSSDEALRTVNQLVKKIEEDIESMKFNTVVSAYMETLNKLTDVMPNVGRDVLELFLLSLSPAAPHLAEELWCLLGHEDSIHASSWPTIDDKMLQRDTCTIVVQVDGKVRGTVKVEASVVKDENFIIKQVLSALNIREKYNIDSKTPHKYIEGRVLNFITK